MRRPAIPARAARRARRAQPSSIEANFRLSPHTPLHTRTITQRNQHETPAGPAGKSVSVLVLRNQRQRRLEQNEKIEQHRPVLDVIEIELDALLDLLVGVDFAAPAIDLRPAGNAGLDAVAGEITIHGLVEQPALQLALHGVRAGADQREIALEHDVEELRQFVEAGLAD